MASRGKIALMNGSNNDPESKRIYDAWRHRHRGGDAISAPAVTFDEVLVAAITDDGAALDDGTADRLARVPATAAATTDDEPPMSLALQLANRKAGVTEMVQTRLQLFLNEESEKLDAGKTTRERP